MEDPMRVDLTIRRAVGSLLIQWMVEMWYLPSIHLISGVSFQSLFSGGQF